MTRSMVIVETVKAEYPKFSKAALSLASRSYETGVTFTPRARELKETAERATAPNTRRKPRRAKSIHFMCRLAEIDAQRVKREMARRELDSVQDLLEGLLLQWVGISEREPGGATNTDRLQGGSENYERPLPSENIKNH